MKSIVGIIRRRILYWLVAMIALLVVGTLIGLIWADTSDVAGFIAVVTSIISAVGIVGLLIALAVVTRRQRANGLGRDRYCPRSGKSEAEAGEQLGHWRNRNACGRAAAS